MYVEKYIKNMNCEGRMKLFLQIVTVIKEISNLERWTSPGKKKCTKMYFLFFFFCPRQINIIRWYIEGGSSVILVDDYVILFSAH